MAEFWSNNDRSYYLRLWVDQVSQNISDNSSQVRLRLALTNGAHTFADYDCTASVTVDGQTFELVRSSIYVESKQLNYAD